ncbi:MMPL family transporter [Pelagibacterales bacterium SAG-MED31]|nr:MMPL family transporter [Pelagibacterales bacterium SAG-MED31]
MSKSKISSLLFITIAMFIFSAIFIKDFRIDASSDTLVAKNDKDFIYYNKYSDLFSSENFLVLAVKNNNKINREFIEKFQFLSKEILKIKKVKRVFSFIDAPILFLNNTSLSSLNAENIETILNSDYDIQEVIKELSNNPIFKNQIINNDANVFSIIIYLDKNLDMEKAKADYNNLKISRNNFLEIKMKYDLERNKFISELREIINKVSDNNEYYLGGIEMIASDVIDFVKKDIIIFSISVILIIILVLFYIFKQFKFVFICLLSSIYSVFIIFGIISFFLIEVTAISSNFSSLIFILSISMNIHIINYYKLLDKELNFKIQKTFTNMFWPCFYTTLTTIVAFGSLIITDIKPIIDFGIIMIISLIVSFVCSFSILPLLLFLAPKNHKPIKNIFNYKNIFSSFTNNFFKIILFTSFVLFILSFGGISKLNVENSFINYFKKNTEIYKGMKLIDEELGGTTPLDIIINFNKFEKIKNIDLAINQENLIRDEDIFDDDFFDDDIFIENETDIWFTKEKIETINNIHYYLDQKQEIGKVQSVISLIEMANLINKKPLEIFELEVLYREIPQEFKESLIYPYLIIDKNMAKITGRVKDSENINRSKLINDIKIYLKNNNNSSVSNYEVNGLLVLYNNMLDSLFESQIKSLGFVIMLIFLMFIILFRSIKLSIIGIIPNIFASSFILGIIGYLSIPLDIMTITIAAITIGIAVDNTIHYLYRFKEFKNKNKLMDSIKLTNSSAGLAVLTTSITIALGFSILSFSSFIPTVLFGIFTSLAMIFAMLGVMVLIPSLLIFSKYD